MGLYTSTKLHLYPLQALHNLTLFTLFIFSYQICDFTQMLLLFYKTNLFWVNFCFHYVHCGLKSSLVFILFSIPVPDTAGVPVKDRWWSRAPENERQHLHRQSPHRVSLCRKGWQRSGNTCCLIMSEPYNPFMSIKRMHGRH